MLRKKFGIQNFFYRIHQVLPLVIFSFGVQAESFHGNAKWRWDASSRHQYDFERDKNAAIHAFGIDYHNTISDTKRDNLTALLQLYYTRIDNLNPHPGFFEDDDDQEFTFRNFNLQWTPTISSPTFKFGRTELPFGIETLEDTNGTIRDYGIGRKVGYKADWGLGLFRLDENLDIEATWTLGSNQEIDYEDGNYVGAFRVGNGRQKTLIYGFSATKRRVDKTVSQNFALDLHWYFNLNRVLFEISKGNKNAVTEMETLLEVGRHSQDETLYYYLQHWYASQNPDAGRVKDNALWAGVDWQVNREVTLEAQYRRRFSSDKKDLNQIWLQIRFQL